MKRYLLPALLLILMAPGAFADAFQISDIRVNGLQRVSAGSVFGALPLNIGDQVDDQELVEATRALFRQSSLRATRQSRAKICSRG